MIVFNGITAFSAVIFCEDCGLLNIALTENIVYGNGI